MEQQVTFYSDGYRMAGVLFSPDGPATPRPGIVMAQGAVGRKELFGFPAIARRFAALGYYTLIFDYRGFGQSDGPPGLGLPLDQAYDVRNAVTFLQAQPGVDRDRITAWGTSLGGGAVVYAAATDPRIRCMVSIVGYGDGEDTLRGRNAQHWEAFLQALARDREERARTGVSRPLPRELAPTPDPANVEVRARVVGGPELGDTRTPDFPMLALERRLEFKPIEIVDRIAPRASLFIAAEKDTLTPAAGIEAMARRAREPKQYVALPGISHYHVYEEPYISQIIQLTHKWVQAH